MKTPDEIKKGLECCYMNNCDGCPYDTDGCADNEGKADALAYINQLENAVGFYQDTINMLDAKVAKFEQRLAQAERERDAMLLDMQRYSMCGACKRFVDGKKCPMYEDCDYAKVGHFEWRGVCEENSKEGEV